MSTCQGTTSAGAKCSNKAKFEFEGEGYCGIHIRSKKKSTVSTPSQKCEGLTGNGSTCSKAANYEYQGKYYCKTHHKIATKPTKEVHQCEGTYKNGRRCSNTGGYCYEGMYYCKKHYKQDEPMHDANPPSYPEFNKKYSSTHTGQEPKQAKPKKYSNYDEFFEEMRKKSQQREAQPQAPPKQQPKPASPDKPTLSQEEQDLLNLVHGFLNMHIESNEIKKRGMKILIKIHPDKCRHPNIDSHGLTQQVIAKMQMA